MGPPFRPVAKVWKSEPALEGAGVRLRRVFGFRELAQLDPFLLLDSFKSDRRDDYRRGFPWHPHRGIETITYVLDGDVEHEDSLGNGGVISSGDVQWMTAGGGILHQEMPKGDAKGRLWGFQLWANLPAAEKMMAPRYREVKRAQIPVAKTPEGATVRVVAGELGGATGPVREIVTAPQFLDVSAPPDGAFTHRVEPSHTAFAFVIEGAGRFEPAGAGSGTEPELLGPDTLVLFGPGPAVRVEAGRDGVRFLLVSGRPLKEPIAWHGPIVMNTQEELRTAFKEFEKGTFIK